MRLQTRPCKIPFKKAGFCKIEEDDTVSDDQFVALKDTITQLINLDKTFEDVTVEDVASFNDMLVSTQEPLSDEDILAGFLPIALREKCPNTEFFLVPIFPHSNWLRRGTSYLSVFSRNAGKYRQEKTLFLVTFHTVLMFMSSTSPTMRRNLNLRFPKF